MAAGTERRGKPGAANQRTQSIGRVRRVRPRDGLYDTVPLVSNTLCTPAFRTAGFALSVLAVRKKHTFKKNLNRDGNSGHD